jgi:hypothetical protein
LTRYYLVGKKCLGVSDLSQGVPIANGIDGSQPKIDDRPPCLAKGLLNETTHATLFLSLNDLVIIERTGLLNGFRTGEVASMLQGAHPPPGSGIAKPLGILDNLLGESLTGFGVGEGLGAAKQSGG